MKNNKKIDVLFYLIVIIIGIIIAVSYNLSIKKTYNTLTELAYKEKEIVLKQSVENIISVIESVRDEYLLKSDKTPISTEEKALIDLEVKDLAINIIKSQNTNKNQYFWINEVINYDGGDNYAIRIVHQNLSETEGAYLSTNTKDFEGNLPYLNELEKIKENGFVLHDYYFKNKVDDRITKKLSYAKLYEPYNWIIATGIPYEDIYVHANNINERNKNRTVLIYFIDILFTLFFCLTFYFYRKKELYKEKEKVAIEKNKFKTDCIEGITHDLRTPINSIVGLSDLLNTGSFNEEELLQYLSKINMSSKFIASLIDDILDVSAIDAGKLIINDDLFNIKELIHPLSSLFDLYCDDKNITFNCNIQNIEFEDMYGDVSRIRQIISNLLSNSIKFTESGGSINFTIVQSKYSSDQVILTISVSDTGCGISEENLQNIFNKFEQCSLSIKQKYGGNGLGLSIVSNLVGLMNGEINVQSKLNEGSTFVVKIPFKIPLNKKEEIIIKKSINILIVDNNIDSQSITKKSELYGFNCIIVDDIKSSIKILKEKAKKKVYFDYLFISSDDKSFDKNESKILSLIITNNTDVIFTSYSKKQYKKDAMFREIRRPLLFSSILEVVNEKDNYLKNNNNEIKDDLIGMKVLLAEDNEINKFVATKILMARGIEVEYANNGQETIDIFNNHGENYFDLILMDKKMPIVDGIEATKIIRKSKLSYGAKISIYGLSANNTNNAIEECLSAGMDGYLTKPIDIKHLYKILENVFYKKK